MNRKTLRWSGAALAVLSAAVFGAAVWEMSDRLQERREIDPVELHYFITLAADEFEYLGRPVRIKTIAADRGGEVSVTYGDATSSFPIVGRDVPELGEITRHNDWLRVLLLAGEAGNRADQHALMKETAPGSALVLVSRAAAPGLDPDTWGSANYKDWVYQFIIFEPDGTLTRFTRTYRELAADPHSWEFAAAMNVTPSLHTPAMRSSSPMAYPNYGPVRDSINAMGWTWPAAGVSVLTLLIGLMMFGGSYVKRRPNAEDARGVS